MAVIECYVDGASRGQGSVDASGKISKEGHGACAVLIYRNDKLIGQYARPLGRRTNNEAEYEAVLLAVQFCWAANLKDPIIYCDSQTVVNQVSGKWVCKSENLKPLLLAIQEIQEVFRFRVQQVPRNVVSQADFLANEILDKLYGPPRRRRKSSRKEE